MTIEPSDGEAADPRWGARAWRAGIEEVSAPGGLCAPLAPRYDLFSVSSPVEPLLPKVSAPRGGIRYVVPDDFGREPTRVELVRVRARRRWRSLRPVRFYLGERRRLVDARSRASDALAVWRGDKYAATTEEDDY